MYCQSSYSSCHDYIPTRKTSSPTRLHQNNYFTIALEKDENTAKPYKDHLYFFRCLAIGKFGKTYHNCNQKAKELFNQYCEHFEVKPQDFKGVELTDFPQLEKYYETCLFGGPR